MKEILKSKLIWTAVAVIALLTALAGFCVEQLIERWGMSEEGTDMIGILSGKADVIMGGQDTEDIRIVNGEKGYFLIKEKGDKDYYLVNLYGEKLLDGKSFVRSEHKVDELIPLHTGEAWEIMNTKTLETVGSADWYALLELHGSKEYMLGYTKDSVGKDYYEVRSIEGDLIYSSNEVLKLPKEEGYVLEGDGAKNKIIDLDTGKCVYNAKLIIKTQH